MNFNRITSSHDLHPLLKRQVKRFLKIDGEIPEHYIDLISSINDAYNQFDTDRVMLERSIELSSAELMAAKNNAEQANRVKSQFLANMSHELRTPMNGIIGLSEILEEGVLSADQKQIVVDIRQCSHSLLSIINEVLDLSKIEADKLKLTNEVFALGDLVTHCEHLFEARAREKKIELVTEVQKEVPKRIVGDELRLGQILINLINNALKFTPADGAVMLYIELLKTHGKVVELGFYVSDTGIGIHPQDQQHIFEAFAQVDGTNTRRFGGTGLGLTISSQLARLMGGAISVRSVPNRGSMFSFNAFFGLADQFECVTAPTWSSPQDNLGPIPHGLSILVAEDNLVNQRVITKLLTKEQHLVTVVSDGQQAVDACASRDFDIILMDIQMPVLDGVRATHLIRDQYKSKTKTPIIAMTAHAMVGDREKYIQSGLDDYISKPISKADLTTILQRWGNSKPSAEQ